LQKGKLRMPQGGAKGVLNEKCVCFLVFFFFGGETTRCGKKSPPKEGLQVAGRLRRGGVPLRSRVQGGAAPGKSWGARTQAKAGKKANKYGKTGEGEKMRRLGKKKGSNRLGGSHRNRHVREKFCPDRLKPRGPKLSPQ